MSFEAAHLIKVYQVHIQLHGQYLTQSHEYQGVRF